MDSGQRHSGMTELPRLLSATVSSRAERGDPAVHTEIASLPAVDRNDDSFNKPKL